MIVDIKKIILILSVVIMGSVLIMHKVSSARQLNARKLYSGEVSAKFTQEKKAGELYLKHLDLKSDKLNYLQKLRSTKSKRELSELIKTAEIKSEDNIKNEEMLKEQAINKNKEKQNESTTSSSELKDEKTSAPLASSVPSSSQEQEGHAQISASCQHKSSITTHTSIQCTDGLNFNGKHYDIKSFTGLGHVPVDEYVYQWVDYTEHLHLLAERQSLIGKDVRELGIGSKIIVNNHTYTIYNVLTGVINDYNAYNNLSSGQPALTIQSCDSESENSTLTFWYAS
jgi:hypothetical protein